MFRKAILALVLVGAAFAGGAAINGPGLAWLQRNFAGGPSIIVDNAPGSPSPATTAPAPVKSTGKPPRQFPTAKTPPLQVDLRRPEAPRPAVAKEQAGQAEVPLAPESPATPALSLIPLPETSAATPPPTLTENIPPLELPGEPASPLKANSPKTDPVARLTSAAEVNEPLTPSRDWVEIRKRMKAQGITRYTIEAETDGRARLTCVIPVDGLRAVGHHFESEGDDEYQAVEALLKRVALWKATQE